MKQITKKEAQQKYSIVISKMQKNVKFYLKDNGDIIDSFGDTRYIGNNISSSLDEFYKKMKHYYINAEVGEGYPDYDFVIKAESHKKAKEEAKKILMQDYPEVFTGKYADRFNCNEVNGDELLKVMTIN